MGKKNQSAPKIATKVRASKKKNNKDLKTSSVEDQLPHYINNQNQQKIIRLQNSLSEAINENQHLRLRVSQLEALLVEVSHTIKNQRKQKHDLQSETGNITPYKGKLFQSKPENPEQKEKKLQNNQNSKKEQSKRK